MLEEVLKESLPVRTKLVDVRKRKSNSKFLLRDPGKQVNLLDAVGANREVNAVSLLITDLDHRSVPRSFEESRFTRAENRRGHFNENIEGALRAGVEKL